MLDLINDLRKTSGLTVVLVTHDASVAARASGCSTCSMDASSTIRIARWTVKRPW